MANHHESRARAKKVRAMVEIIDQQMLRQKRNPFDQAGLVVLASLSWIEAVWLTTPSSTNENLVVPPPISTFSTVLCSDFDKSTAPHP